MVEVYMISIALPSRCLRIKRNRKTNRINARIVVGRINAGVSAYSLITDFDYDVKKVGEDAIITVNVTETCIFR